MTEKPPKPVDRTEITVLVDNYTDILINTSLTPVDRRLPYNPARRILAEHGLSCLVRVFSGKKEHTVLLDAGLSSECLPWNACQMGISLAGIEAVVLSHGHYDHIGALENVAAGAGRQIPIIAHPDAVLRRRLNIPGHGTFDQPTADAVALKRAGYDVRLRSDPSTLAAGHLLVTGEVERTTPFEKGMPGAEIERDGTRVPDPIRDDQALVITVKGKGLVVLSGCAHAGIINTVEYARKITGVDKIHAVLGGFHLSGKTFEPVVPPTIDSMRRINPEYLVPMHCTGWKTINRIMTAMPEKCILNTVGTTYVF
ncbi:MAG TPA: MBL fold metallo-hydrolase [Methanoregulaceae archaeon]|nr:MBL fold metallo-hydrolase [Methanoregulaceae archaeon]